MQSSYLGLHAALFAGENGSSYKGGFIAVKPFGVKNRRVTGFRSVFSRPFLGGCAKKGLIGAGSGNPFPDFARLREMYDFRGRDFTHFRGPKILDFGVFRVTRFFGVVRLDGFADPKLRKQLAVAAGFRREETFLFALGISFVEVSTFGRCFLVTF